MYVIGRSVIELNKKTLEFIVQIDESTGEVLAMPYIGEAIKFETEEEITKILKRLPKDFEVFYLTDKDNDENKQWIN